MSRNAIVYQSRNRITGTMCQTIDTRHADSDIPFDAKKGRYAARCVEHNKVVHFTEHYPAGRAIAHVDEWCAKCQRMIASGKRIVNKRGMVSGKESAKDGRDDLRMSAHNNAHDKRWRNGSARRSMKAEAQRNADEEHIYLNPESEAVS